MMGRFKCDNCEVYVMTTYRGGLCEECCDNVKEIEKMIKSKEEAKVKDVVYMPLDELKVYTGKETIEALLEGKTLKTDNGVMYKLDDTIKVSHEQATGWVNGSYSIDYFIKSKFTEVATPQVGDWVRVTHNETKAVIVTGEVTEVVNSLAVRIKDRLLSLEYDWEILSPEQVSEYKREQAFAKVGRKLNEFRSDDFALINSTSEVAVVVSNNNDESVRLHVLNQGGKGYTAKPHQLTPIYFKDNQVCL